MNNIDRKIRNRINRDRPGRKTLDAAREYMLEKRGADSSIPKENVPKKRFSCKAAIAFLSACAVITAVCFCIPLIFPAQQEFEFVFDAQLGSRDIGSLRAYASEYGIDLLAFDGVSTAARVFSYRGKDVFAEETLCFDGFDILFLVRINGSAENERGYEKEEIFYPLKAGDVLSTDIEGLGVYYRLYEDDLYIQFIHKNNIYYLKFSAGGDYDGWQHTVKKLF